MGISSIAGPILAGVMLILHLAVDIGTADSVTPITRQMMLQQLFVEEIGRSDGHSGLKQTRLTRQGTRPFYSETHSSQKRTAANHDHSNNERTIGLGEFIAVLNGIEFRTRHNDYGLRQPSKTSTDYHAVQDIVYPGVPEAVSNKTNIDDMITEMREWFKAWQNQDDSERNYKDFFKPVLCYLEGAWSVAEDLEESFESDRHFLDASSWFDLHEKIRFTSYTGTKSQLENFAFLPTTVMEMVNGTTPLFAQWNYRILCHPLNRDLPLNRFRLIDEVATRMRNKWNMEQLADSRAARYELNPEDTDEWEDKIVNYGLVDELMAEIPGKNNYPGVLYDDAFGMQTYKYGDSTTRLNTAYYHRWFQAKDKDAMGTNTRHRGYADENLFMAMTNNTQVAKMTLDECPDDEQNSCLLTQRWSYAIPLEIIYLSPLSTWNPYGIEYKGKHNSAEGKTVAPNPRNGGLTNDTAFNGTNSKNYYLTPYEFFASEEESTDSADTTLSAVGVLDPQGNVRKTSASGVRVFFPEITGIPGRVRQRYPIFPVYGEGSAVWKELDALKDIVMRPLSNAHLFTENPTLMGGGDTGNSTALEFEVKSPVNGGPLGNDTHKHRFSITVSQMVLMMNGGEVPDITTTLAGDPPNVHYHDLKLIFVPYDPVKDKNGHFEYTQCDDEDRGKKCGDEHPRWFRCLTT